MKIKAFISLSVVGSAFICGSSGEEVAMKAEKAMVITFDSQTQRTYKLLGAENASGSWATLQDGIVGTGGEVTIFYKSESDQKLFFKVETSDGPPGQRSLLSLANLSILNKDLTGYDLEGEDLRGFKFDGSIFDDANLTAANLSDGSFAGAMFNGVDLSAAILSGGYFSNAQFSGADLSHVVAVHVYLYGANLNGANLEGARFVGGTLMNADLRNTNLRGVSFDGTGLAGANFAGVTLTNVSLRAAGSKMNFAGLPVTRSLEYVDFSGANLSGSDLSRNSADVMKLEGANITGVNFEGTSLQGVSMRGRDLRTVFLRGVAISGDWTAVNASGVSMPFSLVFRGLDPTGASFEGANLEGLTADSKSIFSRWGMTNVNFRNANLKGADLEGLIFRNCDFTGADLAYANVVAADFTGCVGLDAEQPGMKFGGWEQGPSATILPDGTSRVGTNPGDRFVAPATLPAKLRFVNDDTGQITSYEFEPTPVVPPGGPIPRTPPRFKISGGDWLGDYTYSANWRMGTLILSFSNRVERYRIYFSSPEGGQLFRSEATGASYLIGSVTVVP
jgi:uncharacterized protein YjbI with pentapeptide repeats